ncbi:phage holin family protein [Sediminihabitans luteus]|nr:phage holin family protein [Sediminihabitans luteus]
MYFLLRLVVTGFTFWLTSLIIDEHFFIESDNTVGGTIIVLLVVALIFTLVNAIVKPIVQILSIPLYILTLGLFHLVINALMLMLTDWITSQTSWGISIEGGFWWALWIAFIISVVSWAITAVLPGLSSSDRR